MRIILLQYRNRYRYWNKEYKIETVLVAGNGTGSTEGGGKGKGKGNTRRQRVRLESKIVWQEMTGLFKGSEEERLERMVKIEAGKQD